MTIQHKNRDGKNGIFKLIICFSFSGGMLRCAFSHQDYSRAKHPAPYILINILCLGRTHSGTFALSYDLRMLGRRSYS
jgi:hypothetical protein